MAKYIWATDLAQFDVNDEALQNFITFDTFSKAVQDAVHHFCGIDCDATIYIAELDYDDLTQQNYFYQILTDMEKIARQDYHHDDLEVVPSDPQSDIIIKYNLKLKILLDEYLFEIDKRDGAIYPHITNIYQYSDGRIWKLTNEKSIYHD